MNSELLAKTLSSLDWNRILERLESYAGSALGRERISALTFHSARDDIQRAQEETSELRALLNQGKAVPIGGIRDIRGLLEQASRGEILVGRELLDVASTLQAAFQLKRFFAGLPDECPRVLSVATRIHDLQELTHLLSSSFDSSGELSSSLYPQLAQLRTRIHALHARIKERLTHLLSSSELATHAQDTYVTVRSDRYVVPLKVQARSMDLGIVHDTSGSGQTVFVEPRQVIPMNNELKVSEAEYKREERRILAELSRKVGLEHTRIVANLEGIAELEFIHARACLSRDIEAVQPVLCRQARIQLREARHPVLVLRGIQVVPNDLSIGQEYQALILSGPNTGGKTVSLKVLGLVALMTRAGLHIPAQSGSEVGIFKQIYTDIGDQQTLEQDLSTFSGHMVGIRNILQDIRDDGAASLVLLDEIAVGTDPVQGAALARSLLEAFVERGCKVVVTTHYAELKTLSVADKRFANGRVEYDAVGMRPTYRVVLGTPGRSYALDIAEKLGLAPALITRARSYLATHQRALEDLLSELEQSLSGARDQKILAERARKDAEALRLRFEERLQEVEKEAAKLREKTLSRFESELKGARDEINRLVEALKQDKGKGFITAADVKKKVAEVARTVREKAPTVQADPLAASKPLTLEQLKPGTKVLVASLKKEGVVASAPSDAGLLEVVIGNLRMKVWADDLRSPGSLGPTGAKSPKKGLDAYVERRAQASEAAIHVEGRPFFGPGGSDSPQEALEHAFQTSQNTLDLRGLRVDEGLDALDRFLDRMSVDGEPYGFIIHGHGTGAMKSAVRQHLRASPYAERYQAGGEGQGGDGATVVAFR